MSWHGLADHGMTWHGISCPGHGMACRAMSRTCTWCVHAAWLPVQAAHAPSWLEPLLSLMQAALLPRCAGGLLSDLATVLRSMWQRMPPQVGGTLQGRLNYTSTQPSCACPSFAHAPNRDPLAACHMPLISDTACLPVALQSMAMVLRSYAALNFTPHELLDAAAEHMAMNLPQYSTQARAGGAGCCGCPAGVGVAAPAACDGMWTSGLS